MTDPGPADRSVPVLEVNLLARRAHYIDVRGQPRTSARHLALVALLVQSRAGITRDEVLDLLWEPKPGVDLGRRLRTLIHEVKASVPAGVLVADGRMLALDRSRVRLDVDALRERLAARDTAGAIRVYEADLLSGCFPEGAPRFMEWAEAERREVRLLFRQHLERAAATGSSLPPDAYLAIARALVALDATDPGALTHLLRAQLLAGAAAGALETAAHVRSLLAERGRPPAPELAGLLERAEAPTAAAPVTDTELPLPAFVGRERELQAFAAALGRARSEGAGAVLGFAGHEGIGKTRLFAELERRAYVEGAHVLHARAYELEARTPYALLVELLGPLVRGEAAGPRAGATTSVLAELFPSLRRSPEEPEGGTEAGAERVALHGAVVELVQRASRSRPVVLLIDDAHWLDGESRETLHRIALAAREWPIIVALAYREVHAHVVNPLLFSAGASIHRVGPLTPDEVGALLDSLAAFGPDGLRARLVRILMAASGGVPLPILQFLLHLHESGVVRIEGGAWHAPSLVDEVGGSAAESAVALIGRRLAQFDRTERLVLTACAVLDRPSSAAEVATIAGLAGEPIAEAIDRLLQHRLLERPDGLLRVAHAEVGAAALRRTDRHRLQAMFLVALREARAEDATRHPASRLRLLRLACGAGLRLDSRIALHEILVELWRSSRAARDQDLDELRRQIREWCTVPALQAELDGDLDRFRANDASARVTLRNLRRMERIRDAARTVDRPWLRHLAASLALGVALGLVMWRMSLPDPPRLGGGGTLIVRDTTGAVRGLRITGPTLRDVEEVAATFEAEPKLYRPGGTDWLTICYPAAGGPPEVCLRDVAGNERVLASSPGDDSPSGWSPDGRFVLFRTDRFSGDSYNYDIAVLDLANGTVRNLTADPYLNRRAAWSPDGSRIAFIISRAEADTLWIAEVSGHRIHAAVIPGEIGDIVWSGDGRRIALSARRDHARSLYLLNAMDPGDVRRIAGPGSFGLLRVSPDGTLLGYTVLSETRPPRFRIVAPADPAQPPIESEPGLELLAWLQERPPAFVDRVVPVRDTVRLRVGEIARVALRAVNSDGAETRVFAPSAAGGDDILVTRGDTLFARSPGTTVVQATNGGWRATAITVQVAPAPTEVALFGEDWSAGIDTADWLPWGDPLPTVVPVATGGRALRNNGDRAYPSGLVTRQAFSLRNGLTLEWRQRTPLTGDFWQEIWVDFARLTLDSVAAGPQSPYMGDGVVRFRTPLLENQPPVPMVHACDNGSLPFDSVFTRTRWHTVTVRLHGSGACEFSVDGKLIFRDVPLQRAWPDSVHLLVGGRTHRTDILVGEIRVRGGADAIAPDSSIRSALSRRGRD